MHIILWEYKVKPEKQNEFEKAYAPNGVWVDLFKKAAGYLGSELLRDEAGPRRYITIDRWDSKDDHEAFLSQYEKEYMALDARCVELTEEESLLGSWKSA